MKIKYPPFYQRIYSVWLRHILVYRRNLLSNAFPPFVEPLIFLFGLGLGLGSYINSINSSSYIVFLAGGLLMTSSMFTAAYECTYGTFIRLEFDKVYDGILSATITVKDLIIGEILWAGTKGLFFSGAVLLIMLLLQIFSFQIPILFIPLVGALNGIMFGSIALFITAYVYNMNTFNFFFSGLISPMFFFSGVVFPLDSMPRHIIWISECLPLTHSVRLSRSLANFQLDPLIIFLDLVYIIVFSIFFSSLAIKSLRKRILD